MKKIFRNSRLLVIAFFTVFTASADPAAPVFNSKELPIELKFIGSINNQTIFLLNVSGNEINNDFTIIIRDELNNTIYSEHIKARTFSKKFLFNKDELGDETLQFEVFCRKTNQSVVYKIYRQYSSPDDLVARELK